MSESVVTNGTVHLLTIKWEACNKETGMVNWWRGGDEDKNLDRTLTIESENYS